MCWKHEPKHFRNSLEFELSSLMFYQYLRSSTPPYVSNICLFAWEGFAYTSHPVHSTRIITREDLVWTAVLLLLRDCTVRVYCYRCTNTNNAYIIIHSIALGLAKLSTPTCIILWHGKLKHEIIIVVWCKSFLMCLCFHIMFNIYLYTG